VSATLDKEGEIVACFVKGELNIFVTDASAQAIKVQLPAQDKNFSFKTHPDIHKKAFKKNVLTPKDPENRPFPPHRKVPVITWRSKSKEDGDLGPITVNCWPSAGSEDSTVVAMEYELQHEDRVIQNLVVSIPVASSVAPVVQNCAGDYKYDARSKTLTWTVDLIDQDNSDGSLEFVVANLGSVSELFPIDIHFTSESTICGIDVLAVASLAQDEEVEFSHEYCLTADSYQVVEEVDD